MEKGTIRIMKLMVGKLVRMDKWGGAHTELRNLTKGLPEHFTQSNRGKKAIAEAIKELANKSLVNVKRSTGELHVSLNPKQAKEIMLFYEDSAAK